MVVEAELGLRSGLNRWSQGGFYTGHRHIPLYFHRAFLDIIKKLNACKEELCPLASLLGEAAISNPGNISAQEAVK